MYVCPLYGGQTASVTCEFTEKNVERAPQKMKPSEGCVQTVLRLSSPKRKSELQLVRVTPSLSHHGCAYDSTLRAASCMRGQTERSLLLVCLRSC